MGLDIGTSSIKIVELSQEGDKVELTNYGSLSGGPGQIFQSSAVKISLKQTTDAIRQVLAETRIAPARTTMSIPIFSGFSTVISLPPMPEAELAQAVSFEAKKYIPLPLSEVQFEWTKLENSTTNARTPPSVEDFTYVEVSADKSAGTHPPAESQTSFGGTTPKGATGTNVLVVAVTSDLINRYKEIAKSTGLTLSSLELDTFSLARALKREEEGTALIIDIGAQSTILTIIEKEWPVVTRTLDVAGREFSKVLASSLGIDFARAAAMKRKEGVEAGRGVLYPLIDTIVAEGKRMMEEYTRRHKAAVERVIISGGGAQMPGVLNYMVKKMGKESVMAFPFRGILYPEELDGTLREIGPLFSVAAGAALREFL